MACTTPFLPVTLICVHALLLSRPWRIERRKVLAWLAGFLVLSALILFIPGEQESGGMGYMSYTMSAWEVQVRRFWIAQTVLNLLAILFWWLWHRQAKHKTTVAEALADVDLEP